MTERSETEISYEHVTGYSWELSLLVLQVTLLLMKTFTGVSEVVLKDNIKVGGSIVIRYNAHTI